MTENQIQSLKVGDWLMPEGVNIASSIRILEASQNGFKVKRVNLTYNGEEFFMGTKMLLESKWILIPNNCQLCFF